MHPLLIFGIVLLPKAYALMCYECLLGASGTCTDKQTVCPTKDHVCGAVRVISYAGGSKIGDLNMKTCALAKQCVEGSLNLGVSRTVVTSKCCNTTLCNSQPAPEPSKSNPNGRKCFTCNGEMCTETLNCMGNEDHCLSTSVTLGDQKINMKGCASRQLCEDTDTAQMKAAFSGVIDCCQGNYCNSASSTSAGLLLLMASLSSLLMFS